MDDADYAAYLKQVGIPEMMIPMLTTKAGIRIGFAEVESNDLETLLNRPVTPINKAALSPHLVSLYGEVHCS